MSEPKRGWLARQFSKVQAESNKVANLEKEIRRLRAELETAEDVGRIEKDRADTIQNHLEHVQRERDEARAKCAEALHGLNALARVYVINTEHGNYFYCKLCKVEAKNWREAQHIEDCPLKHNSGQLLLHRLEALERFIQSVEHFDASDSRSGVLLKLHAREALAAVRGQEEKNP